MDICLLSHAGESLSHRHRQAAPEPFLKAMAPYRAGLGMAVEWMVTWYWLADRCAQEGLAFGLGQARYRRARHGGTAKHATIDAHQIAVLLRGGMRPQAYVDPAQRRAPRDLLRRRTQLLRTRAELLAQVQNPHSPDHLPELGKNIADQASRDGVAERCAAPAVQKSLAVDLALSTHDDQQLTALERSRVKAATHPDANPLYLWHTGPGMGQILSRVRRDEIQDSARFPRDQPQVSVLAVWFDGVFERRGTPRPLIPAPWAGAWTPALAPAPGSIGAPR
jgi:hypothetical protein